MDHQEIIEKLRERVREVLEPAPGCHDYEHTLRVLRNARMIAESEAEANLEVIELASLLHDIARPEEMAVQGKICHAERGAEAGIAILRELGINDSELLKRIENCIRRHRYRSELPPESLEEKIVYDADKLDSIGAIGIGRAFHFAGRIGAKVHNREDEALSASSYSNEDSAYREYLVKLRNIQEKMLTATGCKVAKERAKFIHDFFAELNNEVMSEEKKSG